MKKYFTLTKAGILDVLVLRVGLFVSFFGNIIYLIIVYFLWKAIFNSSPNGIVNGMTFSDTMLYLVLAGSLVSVLEVYLVWQMGNMIQAGNIVLLLLKPIRFGAYMFFNNTGAVVVNFLVVFLPTAIIVYYVSGCGIPLGGNLLYFIPAFLLGFIINHLINMMIGTLCLYTQSAWGINIMKEVIIGLLSGASIPLAFFPDGIRGVVECLPFQSIYHTPLQILLHNDLSATTLGKMYATQFMWLVILLICATLFWKQSLKKITVNGG